MLFFRYSSFFYGGSPERYAFLIFQDPAFKGVEQYTGLAPTLHTLPLQQCMCNGAFLNDDNIHFKVALDLEYNNTDDLWN